MVLWLPFDETNGPISANLASPTNSGTQINHPTPWLGAHVANSLLFDGTSYVTVPNYPAIELVTNDLTIDAWIYDLGTTNNVIIDKFFTDNTGTFGFGLWLNPQAGLTYSMTGSGGRTEFVEGHPITGSTWHFVAVSVSESADPAQGFFYVDGVLTGTFSPPPYSLRNTNSLWVGASLLGISSPTASAYPWVGALDEVEVYNRALSTNELYAIYSADKAGKCKPCCYLKTLTISKVTSTTVEVNWGGCGILEGSTNVLGHWAPVQNATSPYVIPATGLEMFYRLECQ
jgi:hypothetical protein